MNLTTEELQTLRQISEDYQKIKFYIGELTCKISEMDDQLARLESEKGDCLDSYKVIIEKDKELNRKLVEKYGAGSINIETGEITSI